MIIYVIVKTAKAIGLRTLHSAHLSEKVALDFLRSSGFPVVESNNPEFAFETSLCYFEIEEVYLFKE